MSTSVNVPTSVSGSDSQTIQITARPTGDVAVANALPALQVIKESNGVRTSKIYGTDGVTDLSATHQVAPPVRSFPYKRDMAADEVFGKAQFDALFAGAMVNSISVAVQGTGGEFVLDGVTSTVVDGQSDGFQQIDGRKAWSVKAGNVGAELNITYSAY